MYIIIPGTPIPQQTHRTLFRFKRSVTYDPNARDKYTIKIQVGSYLKENYADFEKFQFPRVSFLFHFPVPTYMNKKEKEIARKGYVKHVKRPDADNLCKLYLDCIKEPLFNDDACVSIGLALKTYHEHPKTIIHVEETDKILKEWELNHLIYSPDGDYQEFPKVSDERICFLCGSQYPLIDTHRLTAGTSLPPNGESSGMREFLALWDQAQSSSGHAGTNDSRRG